MKRQLFYLDLCIQNAAKRKQTRRVLLNHPKKLNTRTKTEKIRRHRENTIKNLYWSTNVILSDRRILQNAEKDTRKTHHRPGRNYRVVLHIVVPRSGFFVSHLTSTRKTLHNAHLLVQNFRITRPPTDYSYSFVPFSVVRSRVSNELRYETMRVEKEKPDKKITANCATLFFLLFRHCSFLSLGIKRTTSFTFFLFKLRIFFVYGGPKKRNADKLCSTGKEKNDWSFMQQYFRSLLD